RASVCAPARAGRGCSTAVNADSPQGAAMRCRLSNPLLAVALAVGTVVAGLAPAAPATAADGNVTLTEHSRLADRRFVVTGDRFSEVGAEDGRYPATGWHIRGEMGGFWTPPIKLLDGLWFGVDGKWLTATSFTSGQGFVRMDLAGPNGLRVSRVDLAPDGGRATLVGLPFSGASRRVA